MEVRNDSVLGQRGNDRGDGSDWIESEGSQPDHDLLGPFLGQQVFSK